MAGVAAVLSAAPRVRQVIVGDDHRGVVFAEVDVDVATADAPADVVGHVVPRGFPIRLFQ